MIIIVLFLATLGTKLTSNCQATTAKQIGSQLEYVIVCAVTLNASLNSLRYIAICHPFLLHQDRIQRSTQAPSSSQANNTNSLKKRTLAYMLPGI